MTTLYNCRNDGDQHRMTKFDGNMNVQASYLLTLEECECPAGSRPSCRHRQMLPKFLQRGAVDTDWFYDFDREGWIQSRINDQGEVTSLACLPRPLEETPRGTPLQTYLNRLREIRACREK